VLYIALHIKVNMSQHIDQLEKMVLDLKVLAASGKKKNLTSARKILLSMKVHIGQARKELLELYKIPRRPLKLVRQVGYVAPEKEPTKP
jgi:hypothetical protein